MLVTLQCMQLTPSPLRPLTTEGSLPTCSQSNSCAQRRTKKALRQYLLLLQSSSSRSGPSLTSRCVWRVLSLQLEHLRRFWPPLFGCVLRGSKGELLAPKQWKGARHQFAKQCEASPHKTLRLDVLAHHRLRKAAGSRLKNNGIREEVWQVGWLGTRAVWSMDETSFDTTNLRRVNRSGGWLFPQPP